MWNMVKYLFAIHSFLCVDVSCLQEMAVMFACMKKNDFKEIKCTPEIDGFMTCYNQHRVMEGL